MRAAPRQIPREVLALILLAAIFSSASSQSGRRAAGNVEKVPAVITENPHPAAALTPSNQAKRRLLVARQTTHKHLPTEDAAFASFVKRLNEYPEVNANFIGDMQHSQAIKLARSETEIPVVVLSFDIDSYAAGTIILNSQDLEIEYFLFAPQTGKKQTQGKVYFQGVGSGRLRKSNWPNGTPVKMTPEAAGIEAAESLYQWLVFDAARKKQT